MFVGELLAKVSADTRSFHRDMGRARDELGRFTKQGAAVGSTYTKSMSIASSAVGDLGRAYDKATRIVQEGSVDASVSVDRMGKSAVNASSQITTGFTKTGKVVQQFGADSSRAINSISASRPTNEMAELGRQSERTGKSIVNGMDNASRSTESLRNQVDEANRSMSKIDKAVAGVSSTFASLGKIATAAFAGLSVTTAGLLTSASAIGVSYNNLEQTSRMAFKTLLGTTEEADKMMASLREFGKTSPYPRQALIEGGRQLVAFGIAAKDVIPTLDSIQNAVAAIGGSAEDLQSVVGIIAQINQSQTFGMAELQQFTMRGIDAAGILAKAKGQTAAAYTNELYGNPMHGEDAIKAMNTLIDGMQKKYEGAVANLKTTWFGAVDRIKGAWRDLGSDLIEPFISKGGGGFAVRWANGLADVMRNIQKSVIPSLQPLIEKLGGSLDKIITKAIEFGKSLTGDHVVKFADALKTITPLASAAGAAIVAMSAGSIPYLGGLLGGISPVLAAFMAFSATSPEMRSVTMDLARAFKDLLDAFKPLIPVVTTLVKEILASVAVPIIRRLSSVVEKVSVKLKDWMPLISDTVKRFKWLIAVAGGALAIFKKFPGVFDLLTANPWLIAIGAIVGGLVFAYNKFEWFHDMVDKVVLWFKDTVLPGILEGVRGFMSTLTGGNVDPSKSGFVVFMQRAGKLLHDAWFNVVVPVLQEVGSGFGRMIDAAMGKNVKLKPEDSGIVKFMVNIGKAVHFVWNGILVPIFNTGKDVIEGFVNGLKGESVKAEDTTVYKLFSTLGGLLKDLWETVISPTIGFIKDAIKSFTEGLTGKNKTRLDKFNSAMHKLGQYTKDVSGFFSDVVDWVQKAIDKLGDFEGAAGNAGKSKGSIGGLDNFGFGKGAGGEVPNGNFKPNGSLITATTGVAENLTWFKNEIVQPWINWSMSSGPGLNDAIDNAIGAFTRFQSFAMSFNPLGPGFQSLAALPKMLGTILPNLSDIGGNLVDTLSNMVGGVEQVFSGANTILRGVLDEFIGVFTIDPARVVSGAAGLITGFGQAITGIVDTVTQGLLGLFRTIWDLVVNAWDATVGPAFSKLWDSIKSWFKDTFGNFTAKVGAPLSNVKDILVQAGKDLIGGLISGMTSMVQPVINVLKGITALFPIHKGPPAKDKVLLRDSGKLIVQGLIAGLESKYADVKSSLSGLTNTLSDAFYDTQLALGYGESVMDGLINGIDGKKKDVVTAMNSATKAAVDAANNNMAKFNIGDAAQTAANLSGSSYGAPPSQPLILNQDNTADIANSISSAITQAMAQQNAMAGSPLIGTQNFYGIEPERTGESMVRGARVLSYSASVPTGSL